MGKGQEERTGNPEGLPYSEYVKVREAERQSKLNKDPDGEFTKLRKGVARKLRNDGNKGYK